MHVICAFQFYHEWSHLVAHEHTARQTAVALGIDWGGGLYMNYLFIGVWMGDVMAWWSACLKLLQVTGLLRPESNPQAITCHFDGTG